MWYRLHPSRAGSMTSIKPGPFQIGSREDRARRRCRTPAPLQGLSGIGIPSSKTQARYTGQFAVRVGVVDQEASLTVGLGKLAANRNRVGLCGLLRLCVFSFSSTLAHTSASGPLATP